MSADKGAVGNIASSIEPMSEKDERRKSQQSLNEYLVKESFVPTGPSQRLRTRKVVRKKKVVDESPLSVVCAWVVEHQIGMLECVRYMHSILTIY
jgi:hypothetical protein